LGQLVNMLEVFMVLWY